MNKLAKTQVEVAKEQKLALSMAVLSQVHLSIVKFNQAKKEYLLAKEYLNVADDIYDLTKIENEVNVNTRLILIKEKLNNILATLRYSSSYANVQNSYGRIYASLGIDENKKPVVNKAEEIPVVENTLKQNEEIKVENKVEISKDKKENVSQSIPTPIKKETKIKDDLFDRNFHNAKITIYEGEKLTINNKEYIVKKSDDISKIAREHGVSVKQIVVENFWLVEKNRVEFK